MILGDMNARIEGRLEKGNVMNIWIVLAIIWIHFIEDFLLQPDEVAINKSSCFRILCVHGFIYGFPFLVFGFKFALVTMILHIAVDFVSSRWTSYLFLIEQRHWFFVVIGLDQVIHLTCLFAMYGRL